MTLGSLIRTMRQFRRLKQCEVAAALGVKPQAVSGWEAGAFDPSISHFLALCALLNVDPNAFVRSLPLRAA